MEGESRTLKSSFAVAEEKRLALEGMYEATSVGYREELEAAIDAYVDCLEQISRLSLFSDNETLEDISTSDMPYLLVNYHLAELIQKTPTPTPHDRRRVLNTTREVYERLLHLLDGYGLLDGSQIKLLEQYSEDPTKFSTISTGADAAARRNAKIANFKMEKELRQKLDFLQKRPEYANFDGSGGGLGEGDEEAVRAVHLAHIAYCVHMTFQGLESLNRELEVLSQAPEPLLPAGGAVSAEGSAAEEDDRRRRAAAVTTDDERVSPPLMRLRSAMDGPLLSRTGKPLQPFTMLGNRQEMARGVFRPGHNLPTMTIDEYLAEERRRGGIIEGGGEASGRVPEPDEDNIEKADAETMKAREWDEFKEANPRGSGNTLNRG
jgi:hypothetical protein